MNSANYDYEKDVRSDYISHLKNECETYTGKISFNGYADKDISWTNYYHGKLVYLNMDDKVVVTKETNIDENKTYKVKYLPKTRLVVSIEEETY